jgi:hypothetical protein
MMMFIGETVLLLKTPSPKLLYHIGKKTVTKTAIPQMPINKRLKALSSSGRGPMLVLEKRLVNCDGLFPCTMGQFSQQTVNSVDVDSGWQKCQERSESKIEDKWREKIKF